MSVSIRPNHTAIGVPQWRHTAAHNFLGQHIPDMTAVTISDGTDYDIALPDSVWLTVMEDLQEHFARKATSTSDPLMRAARETMTPELAASVARGMQQSANGQTVGLGDFTQYVDEEARS